MSDIDLRLDKKLPIALRNEFWIQLTKAVEDEIKLSIEEMDRKKHVYSVSLSNTEDLYDFAKTVFGLPFTVFTNVSNALQYYYNYSDDEIEFLLRRELLKIPFNIMYKGIPSHYHSFFKTLGFSFDHYISIYTTIEDTFDPVTGLALIKRDIRSLTENVDDIIESYSFIDDQGNEIGDITGILGFYGASTLLEQVSKNNFLGEVASQIAPKLDESYSLDGGTVDRLDSADIDPMQTTKHLALEVVLNRAYAKKSGDVLFPYELINYMRESIMYYRKASEIPHVGSQLSLFIDKTGYWGINAQELVRENEIENYDFHRDTIWRRGDYWTISVNKRNLEYFEENKVYGFSEVDAYAYPFENPSLGKVTYFVYEGSAYRESASPSSILRYPSLSVETGNTLRITVMVESIEGISYIIDGDEVIKQTIAEVGEQVYDVEWTTDTSGIGILSSTAIEISSFKVQKVEYYTTPEVRVRSASDLYATGEIIKSITHLAFGAGEQRLPQQDDATYDFPTELALPLAQIAPLEAEKFFDHPDFIGAISEYNGQKVTSIDLHDSTGFLVEGETGSGTFGTDTIFTGNLPSHLAPIKPHTVILVLRDETIEDPEDPIVDFIQDDGLGKLLGQNNSFSGTINYITGAYEITSVFTAQEKETLVSPESEVNQLIGGANVNGEDVEAIDGSILFLFEVDGSEYYIAQDGTGSNFDSNFPTFDAGTSSITIGAGSTSFTLNFTDSHSFEDIRFFYQYEWNQTFSADHNLSVYEMYTNKPFAITEVGVYGLVGEETESRLISYITCAPIELYSNNLHLNMGVILEK